MKELAQKAVSAPRWRWMAGMYTLDGSTVLVVEDGIPSRWTHYKQIYDSYGSVEQRSANWGNQFPDLESPATMGCLTSLVREVWKCPTACVDYTDANFHTGAFWSVVLDWKVFTGSTEAEALVKALLAAD
jgi:hypothetical protein